MELRTQICLVRHGETAWNLEKRLQGHLDVPLNATGIKQARATARRLAGTRFAAIYCSDLGRARVTAHEICTELEQAPQDEPDLRERHYGIFQGLTYDEAASRHPDAYARFLARDPAFAFDGGGESLEKFAARVRALFVRLVEAHAGERILLVTHGGVLDIAHRIASDKALDAPRDFTIPNSAVNWIEHEKGQWRLLSWADQSHLDRALDELSNT